MKPILANRFIAWLLFALGLIASSGAEAQILPDLYHVTDGIFRDHVEYHRLKVPHGGEIILADLHGPGKVTYFYITDDAPGTWYPGLVLKVFWDGEKDPSIIAPLGDFFGAMGGRTIDYQSVFFQINHRCYMCYLPMPFSKHARFVLANDGDKDYDRSVAYGIDYEQSRGYATEKSRLHCAWCRSNPVRAGLHTILDVRGRGQYIGNFLQVFTRAKGWWGEGDTIFHLDGEPLTHSPGTEDEYGSCWGFGHTYSYSYCGYLENSGGTNLMYRWYAANPVRFQHGLKVEIQNQHKDGTPTSADADDYTSVAFWYQEGTHRPIALQPFAERTAFSGAASGE